MHSSPRDWDIWLDAHALGTVDPNSGLQFDSYDHALATAAQGQGIALGMQPYMSRELALGSLVEIFQGKRINHEDDWYFVCRRGKKDTRKIAVFSAWLQQQIASDHDSFAREAPSPG